MAIKTLAHGSQLNSPLENDFHISSIKITCPPIEKYYPGTLYTCLADATLDFLHDLQYDNVC